MQPISIAGYSELRTFTSLAASVEMGSKQPFALRMGEQAFFRLPPKIGRRQPLVVDDDEDVIVALIAGALIVDPAPRANEPNRMIF